MRRLCRSALFVPADRVNSLEKARKLAADFIIYDLEDAVSPLNKEEARKGLRRSIESWVKPRAKGVVVRVNCPLTTPWGKEDILAFQDLGVDAILVPKVESEEAIKETSSLMSGLPTPGLLKPTSIWAMIETAKGVISVDGIASSAAVDCLVFGSNDLTKDLRARHVTSREPLLYSMSRVILSARAYGKGAIDGVHQDVNDEAALRQACIQGKSLGFDGKSLIHPNQIRSTNELFSPTDEEIAHATRVVEAFNKALKDGKGVCVVDGRLVEALHVEQAQQLLEIRKQIENQL